MKLAIDASRSIDRVQKTGVEVVSDALLKTLEATCPADVEIKYYTPEYIPWLPREKQRILPFGRFWTIIHFSWALWKDRPDALFVPVHNLPSWLPKRVVRIIHDISSFRTPDAYALKERLLISRDVRRSRTACQKVIVPTEAVKQDLITLAQFPPDKIIPTGWALDESTILPEDGTIPDETKPYILFIGRIEEKKNVHLLLEAFQLFRATHPDWRLILAGKPGHGFGEIEPQLQAPGVTHLGYITNEEKWRLLRGAAIMAIPSKEEGFSFPMLEAFYAGVPVVASDIPPLHDVGGGACIYVSPLDAQSIRDGFVQLLEQPVQAEVRITLGRERLKLFHWKAIAQKVWEALL